MESADQHQRREPVMADDFHAAAERPLKILLYTTSFAPHIGGIAGMVSMLAEEFVALGHNVVVMTSVAASNDSHPFKVYRVPRFCRQVELIRECDVLVHANISWKSSWQLIFGWRKVIFQHHATYLEGSGVSVPSGRLKRWLARRRPGIAVSSFVARKCGIADVVLNCFDDQIFSNLTPWAQRSRDIAFVGRLTSEKGADLLIESLGHLRSKGVDVSLTIIGDGPERRILESRVRDSGLQSSVRFVGFKRGTELVGELNSHRVIVVPSVVDETFGLVALEGLACGCIPVVSRRGGLLEAIGPHGLAFESGNPVSLADEIEAALRWDVKWQGGQALTTFLAERTRRKTAQQYIEIFRRFAGASIS